MSGSERDAGKPVYVAPLRPDVEILPAGTDDDGSPVHLLHDPLAGTFDRAPWAEWEILRRLGKGPTTLEALAASLAAETTVRAEPEELAWFVGDLHRRGLLCSSSVRSAPELLEEARAADRGALSWLFHNYLYFRIPLLRPNDFLRRTLWLPGILGSRVVTVALLGLLALAIALLAPRLGIFWESLSPFGVWRGGLWIACALVAVKICHEFGHAYAAAVRGAEVKSMGVVFMVMAPLPYSDVTDAWRLSRRDRLAIGIAGVKTELALAAAALVGWAWGAPGTFRNVCLILCSASIASTVLTNLNPGMRFDGYYILSDLLGVENLQHRAFAYVKYSWRRLFLGMDLRDPEPRMAAGGKAALAVYAVYACLYRLGLYFGIALLVYYKFPKILGIVLFGLEISFFIARPVVREVADVARLRGRMRLTLRLAFTLAASAAVVLYLALPLPRRAELAAITVPSGEKVVYAPVSGMVAVNNLVRGRVLRAGETVLEMEAPELDFQIRHAGLEVERSRMAVDLSLAPTDKRLLLRDRFAERERLSTQAAALAIRRDDNRRIAETDLLVIEADDAQRPGTALAKQAFMGRVAPIDSRLIVMAYLPERSVNDLLVGDEAWFAPACDPAGRLRVRIARVFAVNAETVEDPGLTQPFGGAIAVSTSPDGTLRPAEAVYRVEAEPLAGAPTGLRLRQTGTLWAATPPKSLVAEFGLWLYRVVARESGF